MVAADGDGARSRSWSRRATTGAPTRRGDAPADRHLPRPIRRIGPRRGIGVASLGFALVLDALLGEPPEAIHPVVWMGRAVGAALPPDPPGAGLGRRLRGVAVVASGALGTAAVGAVVERAVAQAAARIAALDTTRRSADDRAHPSHGALEAADQVSRPCRRSEEALRAGPHRVAGLLRWCGEAAALWPLLALRALTDAAGRVAGHLAAGNLPAARDDLVWLVGRPTSDLDADLCASAAIESLAENLADSVVAPLLFARVFGIPGAALFRFVNTADAMVGYRDTYRAGGWVAARLDDLLGLLPARVAALAIALCAPAGGGSVCRALAAWWRDRGTTASPNAGHPMAAMAGALGVRLEKPGHYVLNAGGRPPTAGDIGSAIAVVRAATALVLGACAITTTGSSAVQRRHRQPRGAHRQEPSSRPSHGVR